MKACARPAGSKAGDVVLVLGANGKVGQAAIQLATMAGARVFGVERTAEPHIGHASTPVEMIDASTTDIAAHVRERTGGHGADIVYNTVGSPYFEAACKAMAIKGRQIFISTIERAVPFDIFAFYRGRHRFVGIDTLALDSSECAAILDELRPGFDSGALRPFPGAGGLQLPARGRRLGLPGGFEWLARARGPRPLAPFPRGAAGPPRCTCTNHERTGESRCAEPFCSPRPFSPAPPSRRGPTIPSARSP